MRKKKDEPTEERFIGDGDDWAGGNGHASEELLRALAEQLKSLQEEVRDRFEEAEKKYEANQAKVIAANKVYNTPSHEKRRFTQISLRMVDPFSLADTCAAVLSDDVQKGKKSLGQVRRESIYDHLNSVKGTLRNMAGELAVEQEKEALEAARYDEAALGKGM